MKIRENFLYSTNYVNHIRTEVNHDNFFQWKMRYQLKRLEYINASTHNNDKSGIALKAIEKNKHRTTNQSNGTAWRGHEVAKKFSLTRITNEEHTAQERKASPKEFLIFNMFHVINLMAS